MRRPIKTLAVVAMLSLLALLGSTDRATGT
jgi:hypothetical protein